MDNHPKWTQISRRDFFKTTALAGAAVALSTIPATGFAMQNTVASGVVKPSPAGKKRNLLFISTVPEQYENLSDSDSEVIRTRFSSVVLYSRSICVSRN